LDSGKKEWLITQTPIIREKSHSILEGITTHGGFNGKKTITLFLYQGQDKIPHCGKKSFH
jgi:hypothetical protein